MVVMKIVVASHHFVVKPLTEEAKKFVYHFMRGYIYENKQGKEIKYTTYAAGNNARTEFRFHINCYPEFRMMAYDRNLLTKAEIVERPMYEPRAVHLELKDHWEIREEQQTFIDYLNAPVGVKDLITKTYPAGTNSRSRFVGIQTGRGKTATALFALQKRGELFVVIVLARFVEKWVGDIADVLKINKNEILAVQGSDEVQGLTQMSQFPQTLKKIKAIVISNRSYDVYIKSYETYGAEGMKELGYVVPPDELMESLGVGTRLIDELHMEYHSNFRLDLYTHVPRTVSLSATLDNNDVAQQRFYELGYPKAERCPEPELMKYTDAFSVSYSFPSHWQVKTSNRGMTSYNHAAYENSIMKNNAMKVAYFGMVKRYLDEGWKKHYQPGDKFMVVCATTEMCTDFAEWLSKQYPENSIKRFVSGDSKEDNLKKPDGRVTTPGSGGTGHDIKGITDVHNTVNMDSYQSNVQIFGRAREIKGRQTRAWWYNNINIEKHIKYDRRRFDIFRGRAKSISRLSAGPLGREINRQLYH